MASADAQDVKRLTQGGRAQECPIDDLAWASYVGFKKKNLGNAPGRNGKVCIGKALDWGQAVR